MYTLCDSIILISYDNVYKGVIGVSVVWGETKYESRTQVFIRVCNPWLTWLTMSHEVRSAVWVTDYVSRTEYVYQKLSWVSRVTLMSHAATSHTWVSEYESRTVCVTNWVRVSEIELGESCLTYESRTHITYMSLRVWVTNCICVTNWVSVSEIELGGMSESCHMYESRRIHVMSLCDLHSMSHELKFVTNYELQAVCLYRNSSRAVRVSRVTNLIHKVTSLIWVDELCVTNCICVWEFEQASTSESCHTFGSRHIFESQALCHTLMTCMRIWAGQCEWAVSHMSHEVKQMTHELRVTNCICVWQFGKDGISESCHI